MMKKTFVYLLILILIAFPFFADAHLMPAKKGTINVVGNNAYIVMTVPISALNNFDDNNDQLIGPDELVAHGDSLRAQVLDKFSVRDSKMVSTGNSSWLISPKTGDEANESSDYLLLMQSIRFTSPPKNLKVAYSLFGTTADEQQLTLTATQGTKQQVIILSPAHNQSRLFSNSWEAFRDFVRIGVSHILGGYDHLLFLLVIIAAGSGFRYWMSIITSFTVAHSISLALSMWGVVSLSSSIVEPLILFSIVVMGIDAIVNRQRPLWTRTGLVFACGLIHGLGFSSAIIAMEIDQQHKLLSLVGFNLGIELGQAFFISVVLGLFLLTRYMYQVYSKRLAMLTTAVR